MPIYEYCCPKCNDRFELLRPASRADEEANCPKCKRASKKVFSRFASLSKDSAGVTAPIAGGGGGCSSCGASSCSSCGG